MKVDESKLSAGQTWATDTGDDLLKAQLQACMIVLPLLVALASTERCARKSILPDAESGEAKAMSKHSIRREQVMEIREMVSCKNAFAAFAEQNADIFNQAVDPMHLQVADHLIDVNIFVTTVETKTKRLLDIFADSWTADIQKLVSSINSYCPNWEAARDALLSSEPMAKAFLELDERTLLGIVTFLG